MSGMLSLRERGRMGNAAMASRALTKRLEFEALWLEHRSTKRAAHFAGIGLRTAGRYLRRIKEETLTEERKRELARMEVSLNGQPARISRRRKDFALVEQIATGLGCEWSWRSAERIALAGGDFRSC